MTAEEFRTLRLSMGLSAERCAQILGISSGRQIRRWEAGDNKVPGPAAVAMELLYDQWFRARVEQHEREVA